MTIEWTTFAIRLLVGLFLAVGIGIERQWLKTRSILKTNVLVTLGSAMFVMLSIMTPGDASPTRIAAQIVSGVGFLGGGVILREGASVKGINTAATLWCAAAIGALVGSGFLVQAYVSTLIVVGANLLLRPLAEAFRQRDRNTVKPLSATKSLSDSTSSKPKSVLATTDSKNKPTYSCSLICFAESEIKVLKLIADFSQKNKLLLTELHCHSVQEPSELEQQKIKIEANFSAQESSESLENSIELIQIIKDETEVNAIDWQVLQ